MQTPSQSNTNQETNLSSSRKRSLSNLSVDGESKRRVQVHKSAFSSSSSKSVNSFRSITTTTRSITPTIVQYRAGSPDPSDIFPNDLGSPPRTPEKTNPIMPSTSLPQTTDQLLATIPITLQHHTTSNVCEEGGVVQYHKGITPNYPKGYYCCLNAELASRQGALRVVDNSIRLEVYGPRGLLAYVEAADSALIRQEVKAYEQQGGGQRVLLCVKDFLEHRQCTTSSVRPLRYDFTEASWRLVTLLACCECS